MLIKKKKGLESELLSAESPLHLVKTDYFAKVVTELGSNWLPCSCYRVDGVKSLRERLVATSNTLDKTMDKKVQEVNELINSYNVILAVYLILYFHG